MSAEGDQQRRPGAPNDTDGKRRLRTVSYPDPFLVTKLPLEGTVNSGVIRLGERMLLGFIHRPFPDGTRVRVVYDEWLFAERLEEEQDEDNGEEQRAEEPAVEQGPAREPAEEQSAREPEASDSEAGPVEKGEARKGTAGEPVDKGDGSGKAGSEDGHSGKPGSKSASRKKGGAGKGGAKAATANGSGGESTGKRFPEDFNDPDTRSNTDLDGVGDAWTDAFSQSDRDD